MTAESTQTSSRSRRALLAGALGGLAAWAASTAARVNPVEAAAGDPIRMGRLNLASSTATTLQTKTSRAAYLVNQLGPGAAVKGVATSGRAITGEAGNDGTGLWGKSPNYNGVKGQSDTGTGVWAYASSGTGLYAQTSTGYSAVLSGPVRIFTYLEMVQTPDPPAPSNSNVARLFIRNDGTDKNQLCIRFPTGAEQVIATEP